MESTSKSNQDLDSDLVEKVATRINVPRNVVDRAHFLFVRFLEGKCVKGRSKKGIAVACLYVAARQKGVARTLWEVCAVTNTDKKEVGRAFKKIVKELEFPLESTTPSDFMARTCSTLGLPGTVQNGANLIAQTAVRMNILSGRTSCTVAAASIYMASQASELKQSIKEIGQAAGVAAVTICAAYKLMHPHAEILFPKNFIFIIPVDQLPLA